MQCEENINLSIIIKVLFLGEKFTCEIYSRNLCVVKFCLSSRPNLSLIDNFF